jgi:hypothetical protein
MHSVYVFVDWSGESSTLGGTRWFSVGAVIVQDQVKGEREALLKDIAAQLPGRSNSEKLRPLHFHTMRHLTKVGAYRRLMQSGFRSGIVALSDTFRPMPGEIARRNHGFYVIREVLRRAVWLADAWDQSMEVYIDEATTALISRNSKSSFKEGTGAATLAQTGIG